MPSCGVVGLGPSEHWDSKFASFTRTTNIMPTALVIGASRGLGLALTKSLLSKDYTVYATVRSPPSSDTFPPESPSLHVIDGVDLSQESAGERVVSGLAGQKVDLVIVNAGIFKSDVSDHERGHSSASLT